MVFREKPPYSYTENGVQKGFLLERTRQIVNKSGLKVAFEVVPAKRIFAEIEANAEAICSFGWYKNPERERYARFTIPILTDRPHIVLANTASAESVRRHKTLKGLFADSRRSLSVVDGTSYGVELDAMITNSKVLVDKALVSPIQVAQKVAAQRTDFMLMDQDDYEYLLSTDPSFKKAKLVKIEFSDMPPGLKRYILCSQMVDEDVIKRLNTAITTVGIGKLKK
jgi:uncharacterized protein (TIGR02285 family)